MSKTKDMGSTLSINQHHHCHYNIKVLSKYFTMNLKM